MGKKQGNGLTLDQETFCQLYATDTEFFGNGVESYVEAYDCDKSKPNWYKTACSCSSRLLSNAKVCERINELLTDKGLNDQFVDKQLLFVITQHADFGSKVNAIKEYNKLKQRIIDKLDMTSGGKKLEGVKLNVDLSKLNYEELRGLAAKANTAQRGVQNKSGLKGNRS